MTVRRDLDSGPTSVLAPASRDDELVVAARFGHQPVDVPKARFAQDLGELHAQVCQRTVWSQSPKMVTLGQTVVESRRCADHLPPSTPKGGMRGSRTATAPLKAANRFRRPAELPGPRIPGQAIFASKCQLSPPSG